GGPSYTLLCVTRARPPLATLFPYTTLFRSPGVDVQARRHRRLPVGKLPEGFGKAERGFRGLTGVGCGGRRDQIVGNPRPLLAYRNDQLRQDKPGVGKALPNPVGRR